MRTRILIVEDNEPFAENLCEILESRGFEAISARSGSEALETLTRSPPDAIVSDFRLPGISGSEFVASARSLGCSAPVLMLTAYADLTEMQGALHAGVSEVLEKPPNLENLMRKLHALVVK
jgi:CheY-like chemotaxis protein